jgi:hypothetical protein
MSLARVYTVQKSRKEFTCGSCGTTIPKGSKVHHFSVGFRGRTQHRCELHYPSRSTLESSLVAPVWDALDTAEAGLSDCTTTEDFENLLQEVVDSLDEVAGEYEQSEMFERNPELQERADTLNNSSSELQSITFDDEPEEDDSTGWNGHTQYEGALSEWLDEQREKAQEALNSVEVP